jgi:hypothetical protein
MISFGVEFGEGDYVTVFSVLDGQSRVTSSRVVLFRSGGFKCGGQWMFWPVCV